MKKAITIILASVMLVMSIIPVLTSCSEQTEETEETTEIIEEESEMATDKAFEKIYIVKPVTASEQIERLAKGASELISKQTGIATEIVSDTITAYEAKENHYYVIFGDTCYSQSKALSSAAEDKKLYYAATADSVAVYAKTEQLVSIAAEKLFADCVKDGAFEVDEKYNSLTVNASDCVRDGWQLNCPAYTRGRISDAYDTGYGMEAKKDRSYLQLSFVNTEEGYREYLTKLEKYGYKKDFENKIDNNLYASYIGPLGTNVYVYFTASTKEVRIIEDKVSTPLSEFNYKLDASSDSRLYMFKMGYKSEDCILVHLADNSWIIIDGGYTGDLKGTQFVKDLYEFMVSKSNLAAGEKLQIASWYFTHLHSDHFFGMYGLVKEYGDKLDIHRVIDNTPTDGNYFLPVDYRPLYEELLDNIRKNNPDVMYLKVHTGMVVELADTSIEVLFTHEDRITDYYTAKDSYNPNNVSLISVFDIAGLTLLETADNKVYAPYQNYSLETLTTDVLKIAHHYYDKTLDTLYKDLYNTGKVTYCYVTRRDDNAATASNYYAAPTKALFGSRYLEGSATKIYEFYRSGNRVMMNVIS